MEDKSLVAAPLLRVAADDILTEDGKKLTKEEICEAMLFSHSTLVSIPSAVCAYVVKELSGRPDLWSQIRTELDPSSPSYVQDVLGNDTLHACFIEGIRLNTNVLFPVRSCNPNSSLGEFDLGQVDQVGIPGKLFFNGSQAESLYSKAHEYRPERFLGDKPEPTDRFSFWFWSAGLHACPGRNIALGICKVFIANFIRNFDAELVYTSKPNYCSILATGDQVIKVKLTPV